MLVSVRLTNMLKPGQNAELDDATFSEAAPGLVAVVFADTQEDAEHFCSALEHLDVPALIGYHDLAEAGRARAVSGMPVLVPEHLQDRASEILACLDMAASDDYWDDDEEEEDDDDLDDDDEDDVLDPDDDDLDDDLEEEDDEDEVPD